jgi:integrase
MSHIITAIPPLTPSELGHAAQAAVAALLHEGESATPRRSYQTATRYWGAWYALRYRVPLTLPVAPPTVVQFIVDHVDRQVDNGWSCELPPELDAALVHGGFKGRLGVPALATLQHRLAVLAKLHRLHELPNPCRDASVTELLAMVRRAHAKRAGAPRRAPALTREPLVALLGTCDDSLRGKRDRALLLFAWASGGRRRSEVTQATCENTVPLEPGVWTYHLARSKANQAGTERPDDAKPIVGAAASALEAWLAASGIRSGAIFRRIRRGDHIGEPLSPAAVRNIVKTHCGMAGLSSGYSAHSLRSGFVTEAGRQGIALGETMAMTGHASVATVMRYFRTGAATTTRAANLYEEPKGPA